MKKLILSGAAGVVVFVLVGLVITLTKDHQTTQTVKASPQVIQLQKQLQKTQAEAKTHQDADTVAIRNAGNQIILLTQQKAQLCTQLKAARLANPLCQ